MDTIVGITPDDAAGMAEAAPNAVASPAQLAVTGPADPANASSHTTGEALMSVAATVQDTAGTFDRIWSNDT